MKARIKATGEIVEVYSCGERYLECSNMNKSWWEEDLDFNVEGKFAENCFNGIKQGFDYIPDYWTRLEHQYAGMAMQGILSNPESELDYKGDETLPQALAGCAAKVAHALVGKLKEEK